MSYIAHENDGLWSVANSEEILCYLVPRSEAAELLGDDAETVLVSAPAESWFPTLLAALESTTGNVQGSLDDFKAKYEADKLEQRMSQLCSVLSRVAADVGIIGREIERQNSERAERLQAERSQAEREAERQPLLDEYETLATELEQLNAWLKQQLELLRKKSRLGQRATMKDLAGTKQAVRAKEIRKRLSQLEGELVV
jgi:hypothetical protein